MELSSHYLGAMRRSPARVPTIFVFGLFLLGSSIHQFSYAAPNAAPNLERKAPKRAKKNVTAGNSAQPKNDRILMRVDGVGQIPSPPGDSNIVIQNPPTPSNSSATDSGHHRSFSEPSQSEEGSAALERVRRRWSGLDGPPPQGSPPRWLLKEWAKDSPPAQQFKYVQSAREFVDIHMPAHIKRLELLFDHVLDSPDLAYLFPNLRQNRSAAREGIRLHDIGKVSRSQKFLNSHGIPEFLDSLDVKEKTLGRALYQNYGLNLYKDNPSEEEIKLFGQLKQIIGKENAIDYAEIDRFLKAKGFANTAFAKEFKVLELMVDWLDRRMDIAAWEELGKLNTGMVPLSKLLSDPNEKQKFAKPLAGAIELAGGEDKLSAIFKKLERRYPRVVSGYTFEEVKARYYSPLAVKQRWENSYAFRRSAAARARTSPKTQTTGTHFLPTNPLDCLLQFKNFRPRLAPAGAAP